jgi:hypothetical protein
MEIMHEKNYDNFEIGDSWFANKFITKDAIISRVRFLI